MNSHKSFLPHVVSLRAIAILLVVAFHFTYDNNVISYKINRGYIGVDMFMVIMGYFLINGFIQKKDITFLNFFKSKFSRLIFPLAAILCICFVSGIFLLDYTYIEKMGITGMWSLLGGANYELIANSQNYFQFNGKNAMLHTWYLSVAFQLFFVSIVYYILFKNRKYIFHVIMLSLICLASFLFTYCVPNLQEYELSLSSDVKPYLVSYYALVPRIWEFIAGGLIILLPNLSIRKSSIFTLCGLLLIAVVVLYSKILLQTPAVGTLCVVLGTVLIIKYGLFCQRPIKILFSNKILLHIGKISFSLYLVHMPVIVFYRALSPCDPNYGILILLLLLSILLSWCFWYYIEKKKYSILIHFSSWIVAMVLSIILAYTHGLKEYVNVESNAIDYARYDNFRFYDKSQQLLDGYDLSTTVFFNNNEILNYFSTKPISSQVHNQFLAVGDDKVSPSFVLIGDSHAYMSYPGLDVFCKNLGKSGVMLNSVFLPFKNRNIGKADEAYSLNQEKYNAFMGWLKKQKQIHSVVAVFSWHRVVERHDMNVLWSGAHVNESTDKQMESMREFLIDAKKIGKKVVIFTPYPRFVSDKMLTYARMKSRLSLFSHSCHSDYILSLNEHEKKWSHVVDILRRYEQEGLCSVVDITPYFFQNGTSYAIKGNRVLFFDSNHISSDVSIDVIEYVKEDLENILKCNNYNVNTANPD